MTLFHLISFLVVLGLPCCMRAFSTCGMREVLSSYTVRASYCSEWLLLLQSTGSRHSGFSSCGTGT